MDFKVIDGKQYKFVQDFTRKRDAQSLASEQREKGYSVRVINGGIGYNVYQRKLYTKL